MFDLGNLRLDESFNKKMLIRANITEYIRNNSSFEILNALLCFGMQNKSRLEARIIIKMPDMHTKNSNALERNDRILLCCLLLVTMIQIEYNFLGKLNYMRQK
jgi:hypothetical protein